MLGPLRRVGGNLAETGLREQDFGVAYGEPARAEPEGQADEGNPERRSHVLSSLPLTRGVRRSPSRRKCPSGFELPVDRNQPRLEQRDDLSIVALLPVEAEFC